MSPARKVDPVRPLTRVLSGDEWEQSQYAAPSALQSGDIASPGGITRILTGDEWEHAQTLPGPAVKALRIPKLPPLTNDVGDRMSIAPRDASATRADNRTKGKALAPFNIKDPTTYANPVLRQLVNPAMENPLTTAAIPLLAPVPGVGPAVIAATAGQMPFNIALYGWQQHVQQDLSPGARKLVEADPEHVAGEAAAMQALMLGVPFLHAGFKGATDVSGGVMEAGARGLRDFSPSGDASLLKTPQGARVLGSAAAFHGMDVKANPFPPETPLAASWAEGHSATPAGTATATRAPIHAEAPPALVDNYGAPGASGSVDVFGESLPYPPDNLAAQPPVKLSAATQDAVNGFRARARAESDPQMKAWLENQAQYLERTPPETTKPAGPPNAPAATGGVPVSGTEPARQVLYHGTNDPNLAFTKDAPTFFATNPGDVFVKSRQHAIQAHVQMDNPLTLAIAKERLPEIAAAFEREGVDPEHAAEVLKFMRRGDDPQSFFHVTPEMARAYKSLGYDGIRVTEGLKSGEWQIPFSNKQITRIGAPSEPAPVSEPVAAEPAPAQAGTLAAIEGTGEVKTRGLAASVEQQAIAHELATSLGKLPEYKTMDTVDQARRAAELIAADPARARRVALGEEAPPAGMYPEAAFVAIKNKAIAEGDVATIRDVAMSKTTEGATTMGQRIRLLRGESDPESPVEAIQQIVEARAASVKSVPKATAETVATIRKQISASAKKPKDWNAFIDSLRC